MSWPFTRKPEISRAEVLTIALATLLFITYELLWAPDVETIQFYATCTWLADWPEAMRYNMEWIGNESANGNWEEATEHGKDLLFDLAVMVTYAFGVFLPFWVWVRVSWRRYLWDVFGIASLTMGLISLTYEGNDTFGIDEANFWLCVVVNVAGALGFGHFTRIFLIRRVPPSPQPEAAP